MNGTLQEGCVTTLIFDWLIAKHFLTVCSTTDNGQVEICMHGFWGLICADGWDYRDAKIACQQLGYNGCKVTIIIIPMCIFLPSAKTLIQ